MGFQSLPLPWLPREPGTFRAARIDFLPIYNGDRDAADDESGFTTPVRSGVVPHSVEPQDVGRTDERHGRRRGNLVCSEFHGPSVCESDRSSHGARGTGSARRGAGGFR